MVLKLATCLAFFKTKLSFFPDFSDDENVKFLKLIKTCKFKQSCLFWGCGECHQTIILKKKTHFLKKGCN